MCETGGDGVGGCIGRDKGAGFEGCNGGAGVEGGVGTGRVAGRGLLFFGGMDVATSCAGVCCLEVVERKEVRKEEGGGFGVCFGAEDLEGG